MEYIESFWWSRLPDQINKITFNITKEFKQISADVEDEQNTSLNTLNTILSNMIRNISFWADNLIS